MQFGAETDMSEKGADTSVKNQIERSVLEVASTNGNIAIINTLDSRGLCVASKTNSGSTPLSIEDRYYIDATYDMYDWCDTYGDKQNLLQRGADPLYEGAERGQYAKDSLHTASLASDIAIIDTVRSQGIDINSNDSDGNTSIIVAATGGKSEAVDYHLYREADPSVTNRSRRNSLHVASPSGNVDIIGTVLSHGLDIDSKDGVGNTPVMVAALSGRSEAVHYLLDRGADPFVKGQFEGSLLHAASLGGNVDIIEKLLSLGLDIDSKDSNGNTPIKVAAISGKSEAIFCLFNRGADLNV